MPSNVLLMESSNVMVSIFLIHCSAIQIQISERYLLKGQKLMLLKIILVTLKSWERMTFLSLSVLSLSKSQEIIFHGDTTALGWPCASFTFFCFFSSSILISCSSWAAEIQGRIRLSLTRKYYQNHCRYFIKEKL